MQTTHQAVDTVYRQEYGRVLAALISYLGDFDLAEDALQEALLTALEKWPKLGIPRNPGAWLTTIAKRKAIDRIRRKQTHSEKVTILQETAVTHQPDPTESEMNPIPDDRLKLIFTCCHPALAEQAQVALTLRTLGGLTTPEIAHAFLVPEKTMAQRIVRAKRKIRDAGIPYRVPPADLLPERTETVRTVLYLIFNEGYSASSGDNHVRQELCQEAILLTRVLVELLYQKGHQEELPESMGLLALMLLHHARRHARTTIEGDLILLDEQERNLWEQEEIEEGKALLEKALHMRQPGPYQIQAAIAALHVEAKTPQETDWLQIGGLYNELNRISPSPIIELNLAVAIAMADGPMRGLSVLDKLAKTGTLDDYHLFHAARADLLRRAGWHKEALRAYQQALSLTSSQSEQRFLNKRIAELEKNSCE